MDKTVWRQYIPPRIYNITDSTVASKISISKSENIDAGNAYKIKLSIDDKKEVMWLSASLKYYSKGDKYEVLTNEISVIKFKEEPYDFSGFFPFMAKLFYNGRVYAKLDGTIWGEDASYHTLSPFIKNGTDLSTRIIVMQRSTPEKEQEVLKNLKL